MRIIQIVCFAAAVAATPSLVSAEPGVARNLNLQNQNHVGHCTGAGNCRPGRTGTSQPVASKDVPSGPHGGLSPAAKGGK